MEKIKKFSEIAGSLFILLIIFLIAACCCSLESLFNLFAESKKTSNDKAATCPDYDNNF